MRTKINPHKPSLALLLSKLSKNLITLFESGEKKEFQRLKNFITS